MMPDWTILDNCRHSGYATAMPWKRLIPLLPLLICDLAIFVDVTAAGIMSPAIPQFAAIFLSLIHISEPTRLRRISYAVFCLKKKKKKNKKKKTINQIQQKQKKKQQTNKNKNKK